MLVKMHSLGTKVSQMGSDASPDPGPDGGSLANGESNTNSWLIVDNGIRGAVSDVSPSQSVGVAALRVKSMPLMNPITAAPAKPIKTRK